MMWVLIVVASSGTTAETVFDLSQCTQQFRARNVADVQEAYCLSAAGGDKVWIVKDGKSLDWCRQ
jgi:hypothetical protein